MSDDPDRPTSDPELDPAAPAEGELAEGLSASEAVALANGESLPPEEAPLLEAVAAMPLDMQKALGFLSACINAQPRVRYGLGAKAQSDSQRPGAGGFTKIDCSGFVRAAIRRSTNPQVAFPDGSVQQHDWVRNKGYARQTIADGQKSDGKVRAAFLHPSDSPSRIGHVVLVHGGQTLESHGGVGPNRRPWTGQGWQARARVYLLT